MPKTSSYHGVIDLVPKKDEWRGRNRRNLPAAAAVAAARAAENRTRKMRTSDRRNKMLQNEITQDALIAKTNDKIGSLGIKKKGSYIYIVSNG